MKEPNFFIVGAAKSGTTSLYNYLTQHPDIWMPSLKEPHYFGEYRPPGPDIPDLRSYLDLFQGCEDCTAIGEASTAYLYSPSAASEIRETFPNAKIIMVLRNPIERAYSLYWNHVRDGVEDQSFEGALEEEASRVGAGWPFGYHYINSGMYSAQVERYLQAFGRDKVKIFLFEDLKRDAEGVVRDCASFLKVDPRFKIVTNKVYNRSGPPKSKAVFRFLHSASPLKRRLLAPVPKSLKDRLKLKIRDLNVDNVPPMAPETRARLVDVFREDIRCLERIISRDLSNWIEDR